MKIQEMRFNGKRIGAESGPIPNIRHRIKTLVLLTAANPRRVMYTHPWHKFFVVRRLIVGTVYFAHIASASGRRQNAERTPQQVPRRLIRPSASNFRMWLLETAPAQTHLRIIMHLESHLPPELAQRLNISRRLVPKWKL